MTQGKIGVSTGDLFPIIKKFLYSDHEIFLREIISNAVDATRKLRVLANSGDFKEEIGNPRVTVKADKKAGTLTVSDNGIGMTRDEVERYINQIAFSGAEEFLQKYKDNAAAIIGHFGLGFYSAFMVSDRVEILTRSYRPDAAPVHWTCDGTPEYTLDDAEKETRGTDIIMHIADDEQDFLEDNKINELLEKYCKFLPVEITFGKKKEWKDGGYRDTTEDNIINDTNPAWTRKPADLKEADYTDFYHRLYPSARDPLFHIHLNVDYPFNLTGILYFPKIDNRLEIQKNKIQLYCNQVYVTDTVEGIVPDYLTLLHGVIDSPDIPLNVSRSYLQSDRNVKKISSHITKKVTDSLTDIFNASRVDYEAKWDDLKVFFQYGILSDEKFNERAKAIFLYKNTDGKYFTGDEYENLVKPNQTDKEGKIVHLYATDPLEQYTYIQKAKDKGYDVLLLGGQLDPHFINHVEHENPSRRFLRVDADVIDKLVPKNDAPSTTWSVIDRHDATSILTPLLRADGASYNVNFESLGDAQEPLTVTRSEFARRMKEMSAMNPTMSFYGAMDDHYTLVVNTDHRLANTLLADAQSALADALAPVRAAIDAANARKADIDALNKDKKEEEIPQVDKDRSLEIDKELDDLNHQEDDILATYGKESKLAGQLVDLALLANGLLKGESLARFVKRSFDLI
ncbi:MAG: molecular chaperone HtpG [Odoribacteraceae bacterium]|jgi:molecular chaperone HtpG|nr:molecular chaperone HtpG [Odoribacteraceae bacterium]